MQRDRAFRRWQRRRTMDHKAGLLRRIGGEELVYAWTRGTSGKLAKGKIHCSCPMCRMKSYDQISHSEAKAMLRADDWEERDEQKGDYLDDGAIFVTVRQERPILIDNGIGAFSGRR